MKTSDKIKKQISDQVARHEAKLYKLKERPKVAIVEEKMERGHLFYGMWPEPHIPDCISELFQWRQLGPGKIKKALELWPTYTDHFPKYTDDSYVKCLAKCAIEFDAFRNRQKTN